MKATESPMSVHTDECYRKTSAGAPKWRHGTPRSSVGCPGCRSHLYREFGIGHWVDDNKGVNQALKTDASKVRRLRGQTMARLGAPR